MREKIYLLVIPLFASLVIAALFYPGAMSYDTLHALYSARNGVVDSMWPPMVSYVWRVVDLVSLNPSAMHFSQVFLLLFSIYFIVYFFTKNIVHATIFLIFYISLPAILGSMAVIWKDVLMAAFLMAGIAVAMYLKSVVNRWQYIGLFLLAVFLIFLGVCSRHNAITGAVPLIFYLSWVVCIRFITKPKQVLLGVILLGSVLTGSIFFTKTLLDTYSLPGFQRLPSSTSVFIESVRVLDVAGASLCVGSNLFEDVAPSLTLKEISGMYDPRHANLSKGLIERKDLYIRINERWLDVALHHPICFLYNKFELMRYMVGGNKGKQFLITHTVINENEYGYAFQESSLRDAAFTYIVNASGFPLFKPWFIFLLSFGVFIYMFKAGTITAEYFAIFMSGVFYFSGLVMFGNAADARLLFYTTTTLSMFAFVSVVEFKMRR